MRARAAKAVALGVCLGSILVPARVDAEDEVHVRGTRSTFGSGGSSAGGFSSRAVEGQTSREITDAASLVEAMPGVHVRRLGADDSFATLSIRGSSSNQVVLYLAGVPLSGGGDPTVDLATLPLWPGAEARVHRTFAPAAIGPGSLGGTLVLEPPGARLPPRTEVWSALGSFGAARLRVGDVQRVAGGGRLVTALSASRSDDDFTFVERGVERQRVNAGHAAANGLVALTRPFAWGWVQLTTVAQARRQELPGSLRRLTPFGRLVSTRVLQAVEVGHGDVRGAWIGRVWGRRDGLDLDSGRTAGVIGLARSEQVHVAAGTSFGWRGRPSPLVQLEARGELAAERFAPGPSVGRAVAADRRSAGLALDATYLGKTELVASGRADLRADEGGGVSSHTEVRPTAHLGLQREVGPFTLSAHGGAVARPASFLERFGDRGFFLGSPGLRTERAWATDAGVEGRGRVGGARVRVSLIGLAIRADDLIVFVPQGAFGRPRATNIGRARTLGLEADGEVAWRHLDVHLSYTALDTRNLAECTSETGGCARPPLPGRPVHDAVVDLGLTVGPLRARYGLDAIEGMTIDLKGDTRVPLRVLHSTGLRLDVAAVPGLRLALDVRNLTDERTLAYQGLAGADLRPLGDAYDFPLPGRSFLLSARYRREHE